MLLILHSNVYLNLFECSTRTLGPPPSHASPHTDTHDRHSNLGPSRDHLHCGISPKMMLVPLALGARTKQSSITYEVPASGSTADCCSQPLPSPRRLVLHRTRGAASITDHRSRGSRAVSFYPEPNRNLKQRPPKLGGMKQRPQCHDLQYIGERRAAGPKRIGAITQVRVIVAASCS